MVWAVVNKNKIKIIIKRGTPGGKFFIFIFLDLSYIVYCIYEYMLSTSVYLTITYVIHQLLRGYGTSNIYNVYISSLTTNRPDFVWREGGSVTGTGYA